MMKKSPAFWIRFSLSALLFAVITVYSYEKAHDLLKGIRIDVATIEDGASLGSGFVTIEGAARHAAELRLDGRPIMIDPEGAFRESLLLPPGYSILELEATDKFGKTTTKVIRLVNAAAADETLDLPLAAESADGDITPNDDNNG